MKRELRMDYIVPTWLILLLVIMVMVVVVALGVVGFLILRHRKP